MIDWCKKIYSDLENRFPRLHRIGRFVTTGVLATSANILIVFLLTHFLHVWYLISSITGFLLSFIISFYLQKFWTFKHQKRERIKQEFALFFIFILAALGLNTFLVFIFVEHAGFHYLIAQIAAGFFVAIMNYFSYKNFVFV